MTVVVRIRFDSSVGSWVDWKQAKKIRIESVIFLRVLSKPKRRLRKNKMSRTRGKKAK